MPVVPKMTGQQVSPTGAPAVRLSTQVDQRAFGVGLGNTLARSGETVFRAYKHRADATALMEADRKLLEFERDFMYGDNGAIKRVGKDAAGLPDEFEQRWQKTSGEIRAGLSEDQIPAFDSRAQTRYFELSMSVNRHTAQQIDAYETQETQSYVNTLIDHAGRNYYDPNVIAQSGLLIETSLGDFAKSHGRGAAWLKEQTEAKISQMHSTVITQMLAGENYKQAKAYFAQNEKEIDPAQAAKIRDALHTSSVKGQAQAEADKILASTESLSAALEQTKSLDPDVREAAEARIKADWTVRGAVKKQEDDQRFVDATNIVEQKGSWTNIPTPMWQQLTVQERAALKSYWDISRRGIEPVNKDGVYVDFLDKSVQEVARMSKADIMRLRPYLDDAHFNSVLSRWETMRTAGEKKDMSDPKLTSVLSDDERIRRTLVDAGIVDKNFPRSERGRAQNKEAIAEVQPEFERRLNAYEEHELGGKRRATGAEKDKILSDMFAARVHVEKNWWWDKENVPVVKLEEDDLANVYVPYKDFAYQRIGNKQYASGTLMALRNRIRALEVVPVSTKLQDIDNVPDMRRRMQRAVGAARSGASTEEIDAILKGQVR